MKSTCTDEIQIQTDSTSSVKSHCSCCWILNFKSNKKERKKERKTRDSLSCLPEIKEKHKESLIWPMAPQASRFDLTAPERPLPPG